MSSNPKNGSIGRSLAGLFPRSIGWSKSDRDLSRKKFVKIIGSLICAVLGVSVLGFCILLFPRYATVLLLAQLLSLAVLFGLVLAALACARKCFFDPLSRVRHWASKIRQGDFSARVPTSMEDGYAELAEDVNRLAEWLESLSNDAEIQIKQQAERLAAKSQSLQLLYDVSAVINQAPSNEELVDQYLRSLHSVLDAKFARAFMQTPTELRLVATIGEPQADARTWGDAEAAAPGEPSSDTELLRIDVPLQYKDRVLGKYELYFEPDNETLMAEVCGLLPDIGRHLGMAIEKTRLEQETIRLSTMDQRALMANELHDCLAQTLAGLKFQVRVLDETIGQGDESSVWTQMERVENTLEEATLELRDLIAQFRGTGGRRPTVQTIEQVIAQFKRRSDIQVFFHNHWGDIDIPLGWERQTARIIQEALANVHKHSGASTVRVLLRREGDCKLGVIVEDDGTGFEQPVASAHPGEHIGLIIMQERAEQIGGELAVDSEPGDGTRVLLTLRLPSNETSITPITSVA